MRCSVYPSPLFEVNECLILPEGKLLGDLPREVLDRFRHVEVRRTIELDPRKKYVALDAAQAIRNIESQGYHITHAHNDVMEEWPG